MKRTVAMAVIALGMIWSGLALAHHSAVQFDFSKRVTIEGVVKQLRVINPHLSLTLAYTENGVAKEVEFEGHSANNMYRGGWRQDKIKVGDKIKIIIAPRRDGKDGGFVNSMVTKTGEEVGFRPPPPATAPKAGSNAPPPVGEPVNSGTGTTPPAPPK